MTWMVSLKSGLYLNKRRSESSVSAVPGQADQSDRLSMQSSTTADCLSSYAFEMELDEDTECSILFCRSPSADADARRHDTLDCCLSGCYGASTCMIPDYTHHDAMREACRRASRSSRRCTSRTSHHAVTQLHLPKMPATTGLDDREFEHASRSPNAEFGTLTLR